MGEGAPSARSWRPPLPYAILSGVLVLSAIFAFSFAVFTPSGDSTQTYNVISGFLMMAMAIVLGVLGPHSHRDWALDAALVVGIALAGGRTYLLSNDTGLVTVGLVLVLFAVFAAYFRPFGHFVVELLLLLSVYAVVILVNPVDLQFVYFLLVAAVVTIVSLMVALMARELRSLALHDPLTGALNRRGLDLMAEQVRVNAIRAGSPVCVGLMDLDNFKAVNDDRGHDVGDLRLVELVRDWRNGLRRGDVFARFGGDEFVVITPGATPEETRLLAGRIEASSSSDWTIGVTRWDLTEDLEAAIRRADKELYDLKRAR